MVLLCRKDHEFIPFRLIMLGRLKIVVPSFNSVRYLPKTLSSIASQRYTDFDVCVIDDASTLPEQKTIIQDFCQKSGWQTLFHSQNSGPLGSIITGIQALNCRDEDIIVIVDGDDWLADENALSAIVQAYQNPQTWLTYGSFETYPPKCLNITYAAPVSLEVIQKQLYREIPWIFQPLRSFKYHLWKRIKDEDLKDEQGRYYTVTGDRAFFYPLLEMAGTHIHYIPQILYIYNLENPLNDHKISRLDQVEAEKHIKALPKYLPVEPQHERDL